MMTTLVNPPRMLAGALAVAAIALCAADAEAKPTRGPEYIRTELVPLLQKQAPEIPVELLAGWVKVESDGVLGTTTSLGERGYFQIHPDEARELKFFDQFERVSTDQAYSIEQGIRLVRYYRSAATRAGIQQSADAYWPMVKFFHGGIGYAKRVLAAMSKAGVAPTTWANVYDYVKGHQGDFPSVVMRIANNVEVTIRAGRCVMGGQSRCDKNDLMKGDIKPSTFSTSTSPTPTPTTTTTPAFPFDATLNTQGLGFRTQPTIDAPFVFESDKYIEKGQRVRVLRATTTFGAQGAFCEVEYRSRRGYVRCDGDVLAPVR